MKIQERQSFFSRIFQISLGPNGENVGKRILDIDGGQTNKTNNENSRKTKFFFPNFPNFFGTQWGKCGKKNDIDGGQTNKTNNENSGEEQLIAFGEATVEGIGMGPERNSRTVTFELSQRSEDTASPPPLISSDNASK